LLALPSMHAVPGASAGHASSSKSTSGDESVTGTRAGAIGSGVGGAGDADILPASARGIEVARGGE